MLLDPVCQTRLGNVSVEANAMQIDAETHPYEPDNETSLHAMLALIPSRFVERFVGA